MVNYLLIFIFTICGSRNDKADLSPASPEFPFLKAGNEWHFQMKTSQTPTPLEVIYKILSIRNDGYIEVENSFAGLMSDKIYWCADKNEFSDIAYPEDNYKLTLLKLNPFCCRINHLQKIALRSMKRWTPILSITKIPG